MKRTWILSGFFLLACPWGCEGDGCDQQGCDANCRSQGYQGGTCDSGKCVCATCDSSSCNLECVGAGHTGGSCIGGACQCSDACTSHDQCSEATICYHSSCQDPWGKEYQLTVVNGDFPDVDWRTGGEWDFGGSCPDTYVSLTVDSSTCNTAQIDDTCHPRWNKVCNFTLFAASRLTWSLLDEDTMDYDTIETAAPVTLTVADIKGGTLSWYIDYGGTRYFIVNITVAPR